MKRLIGVFLTIAVLLSFACMDVSAANYGSLTVEGKATPGNTFTVKFRATGNVGSYSGTFEYDSSLVTLQGMENGGGQHWASFSSNGNTVFAQRDVGTTDYVSFVAKFKVNEGVAAGTNINIGFSGTIASNADVEDAFSVSATARVEASPSGDASLSSLKVSNATLTPAFNPNITAYSCGTVDYSVEKLLISATANGAGASVTVSGSTLKEGNNSVTVKVTAPSGAWKIYTINCVREHNPNFVPSSDTGLTGIELSEGTLSPEFSVERTEYVVYLPFETGKISITGTPADEAVTGVENIEEAELDEGVNELVVKVTAEDGTVKEYTFYVVRMNAFDGVKTIGYKGSEKDKEEETPVVTPPKETKPEKSGFSVDAVMAFITQNWLYIVIAAACLIVIVVLVTVISKSKRKKKSSDSAEDSGVFEVVEADAVNGNPQVPDDEEIRKMNEKINAQFRQIQLGEEKVVPVADKPRLKRKPEGPKSIQEMVKKAADSGRTEESAVSSAEQGETDAETEKKPSEELKKYIEKPSESAAEKPETKVKVIMHRKDEYIDIVSDSSREVKEESVQEEPVNEEPVPEAPVQEEPASAEPVKEESNDYSDELINEYLSGETDS